MIILQALYFALPMYIANMAPVVVKKLALFDKPLDGGKTWGGKPILGKNKTWRGLFFALAFGLVVVCIQRKLFLTGGFWAGISIFDYSSDQTIMLGGLLAFGAILGDAVKSFAKRRINRPPGSMWFPFDQIDFVIGGLLLGSIVYWPGMAIALILLVVTPIFHIGTNFIAYKLKIKDVPW